MFIAQPKRTIVQQTRGISLRRAFHGHYASQPLQKSERSVASPVRFERANGPTKRFAVDDRRINGKREERDRFARDGIPFRDRERGGSRTSS